MHLLSRSISETLFSHTVKRYMEEDHIMGCSIALLQHGELTLAAHYGYASLQKTPVDDLTLFECASLTKFLLSWLENSVKMAPFLLTALLWNSFRSFHGLMTRAFQPSLRDTFFRIPPAFPTGHRNRCRCCFPQVHASVIQEKVIISCRK